MTGASAVWEKAGHFGMDGDYYLRAGVDVDFDTKDVRGGVYGILRW